MFRPISSQTLQPGSSSLWSALLRLDGARIRFIRCSSSKTRRSSWPRISWRRFVATLSVGALDRCLISVPSSWAPSPSFRRGSEAAVYTRGLCCRLNTIPDRMRGRRRTGGGGSGLRLTAGGLRGPARRSLCDPILEVLGSKRRRSPEAVPPALNPVRSWLHFHRHGRACPGHLSRHSAGVNSTMTFTRLPVSRSRWAGPAGACDRTCASVGEAEPVGSIAPSATRALRRKPPRSSLVQSEAHRR